MFRYFSLTLLVLAVVGCSKDEIKLDDLTTNPFDVDYTGEAIFVVESSETATIMIDGQSVKQLRITVLVRMDLIASNPTFMINAIADIEEWDRHLGSNDLVNNSFELIRNYVAAGTEYCWQVNLKNSNAVGGGNSVCATAE